jgi:thiamine biosynthesis protein ThiC
MGLQSFSVSFSISFDYSGSSNALDCTPHLLATLPPSVLTVALDINFPFVVQAAAINVNWSEVHVALARVGRQIRRAKGEGRVKIIVSNDGAMIEEEERNNVESLFMDNFSMIKDLLQIEFSP